MVSPAGSINNSYGRGRRPGATSLVATALASLLRNSISRPMQVLSRKVPPPVLLLLAVQSFWLLYDRCITFQNPFPPPRPYIRPTDSSPLSPFYGPPYDPYNGPTRAFPSRSSSFPCTTLRSEADFANPGTVLMKSGFFYLMQPDVAATSLASVTSRIAHNVAQREHAADISSISSSNATTCAAWAAPIKAKRFKNRSRNDSFLWTFVREPVDRLVSRFFHSAVSLGGQEGTLDNFKAFLEKNAYTLSGSYMKTMTLRRYVNPQRTDLYPQYTSEILSVYDFVGVQERWEESLAVLQLLSGVETQDMLYLPSKVEAVSSYELVESEPTKRSPIQTCVKLQPPQITLPWKEYLHQPFMFEEVFEPDVYIYKAMNASLDATIASLGRDKVDQTIRQLQWAQAEVESRGCAQSAVFPCSAEGQVQSTIDCLVGNVGCGSQCLDSVGKNLSTNPAFLQLK